MSSAPDVIIGRVVDTLSSRPGVRGIALVGSRGGVEPDRVDQYSDADFLVCCQEGEHARLLTEDWIRLVGPPVLVFPRVMDDEIRVLFPGLFACELHLLTIAQLEQLSGPCRIGSYIESGFRILHDPDGHFSRLASRVRPEPGGDRDPAVASSAFWYNVAYSANLILRGDLFRASQFTNWYLQLFLLDLPYSIEEPDATKYVAQKVHPAQYEALACTFAPLTRDSMIAGLRRLMSCYWQFQAHVAPDIDPALLASYREIEREVGRRLSTLTS